MINFGVQQCSVSMTNNSDTFRKVSMTENKQLETIEAAQSGSRLSRIIPVALLCALVLAVAVNTARGKSDQTFQGVVVMDYPRYEFYPDEKDCHPKGTAYWLIPNHRFHDVVPMPGTSDLNLDHLDRLNHATWRVKLHGNLSHIGRYGFQGKHWRELEVLYVIDFRQLDCRDESASSIR
jgi:hypothetical protein